ncbi:class I SAM-dependent methyltransferase [Candidatus Magnetaquicoccus inordinatus]|uniref:class I SAM-dependent methyltransferase n=1 Tax=Candidatus Magnetaquicoccus inordinatus TaxID=2496818 RepID=UPI00102C80C9|nr:methyltransferase domain-containing protein [Candidatus Magnetaquicoccus inordinatus]
MKPYYAPVLSLIRQRQIRTILDAPAGTGWLAAALGSDYQVDGLDLFCQPPAHYRQFAARDLNEAIPAEWGLYDCIVTCEGIEHLLDPVMFLRSAGAHLQPNGLLIITTPNVWYPAARLQYLFRGFFPSFPNLIGKVRPGMHMHLFPWTFPQLYLVLHLLGFQRIQLHTSAWPAPKHLYEHLLAWPQQLYCRAKAKQAVDAEERAFWQMAASPAALLARGLVVSAEKRQ